MVAMNIIVALGWTKWEVHKKQESKENLPRQGIVEIFNVVLIMLVSLT
jgi:hypothetical protein